MKATSANSKGVGKLGANIYRINHGEQVVSAYQPKVSNPSTADQVGQRSRFKLASQISASLADVIVIPRKGMTSPRNLFVKKNMPYFYGDVDGAFVALTELQITAGSIKLPNLKVLRMTEDLIYVNFTSDIYPTFSRVIYNVYEVRSDDTLLFYTSEVVEVNDANGVADVELPAPAGDCIIYAYGISDKDAQATAAYQNMGVTSGQDVARLVASRKLSTNNYRFSATKAVLLKAGENESVTPSDGQVAIKITAGQDGTFKVGAGDNITSTTVLVTKGQTFTATAVPNTGYDFLGWFNAGEQFSFSTSEQVSFTASENRSIICQFKSSGLE